MLACFTLLAFPPGASAVNAPAPSRTTVLEVQALFEQLGYPLANLHRGELGVSTRGALSYFQRKYHLPQTGYPDPRTIAAMRSVAASLRGIPGSGAAGALPGAVAQHPSGRASQPRDLVERIAPGDLPFLTIAVVLAAAVGLLALNSRRTRAQDSADDTAPPDSVES